MKRLLLIISSFFIVLLATANTIVVKNIAELNAANKSAKPGDTVILERGEWKDVTIALDCHGTSSQLITFKARSGGEVMITGNSRIKLGGSFLVVEGLLFTDGYAGKDAVIDFKINNEKLANDCRVTNCMVLDFNNPKRMDENYWVSFSGKNNRIDHCSFIDKKNLGVLIAVTLEDDRSRDNFHSIDSNFFGRRPPLASNGGEIIRVGVSQHCQYNSNTIITDNYFSECDGETEIISIKSGSNIVKRNLFYECQGGVVLRHGDNNTVIDNLFIGNDKEGTGGVRVINRGQWVVNNLFYKCRGVDFRSPLSIMNGVPNSPANRYVQVTDAVIANNSFYQCSPVSFCEGSDKERSLPPANVFVINNIFYNDKDDIIYKVYDKISGFNFIGNKASMQLKQALSKGFNKSLFLTQKTSDIALPRTYTSSKQAISDSLQQAAINRLGRKLSTSAGFSDLQLAMDVRANMNATGNNGFDVAYTPPEKASKNCSTADEVYQCLNSNEPVMINLTGALYNFSKPLFIKKGVVIRGNGRSIMLGSNEMPGLFIIAGSGHLTLENLTLNGGSVRASHFISSDTSGSSDHYNLVVKNCSIGKLDRSNGCQDLFYACKSMIADSIVFRNNTFSNNNIDYFVMNQEKDDKGYYNAEKIIISKNNFSNGNGILMDVYRGGNDESTMGPQLFVMGNSFTRFSSSNDQPLIQLTGVQKTRFTQNKFDSCNPGKKLFVYKDIVRADHLLGDNSITGSGEIDGNGFLKKQ